MWACCMNLVLAHCQLQGGEGAEAAVSGVGVNWGAIASHPMEPHIVVNLLKENVSAFSGTDIEVMVGIPNDQLKELSKDQDNAEDWVKQNVSKHAHDEGVNIRCVYVYTIPSHKTQVILFSWKMFKRLLIRLV